MGYFTQIAGKSFLYDLGFKYGEEANVDLQQQYNMDMKHCGLQLILLKIKCIYIMNIIAEECFGMMKYIFLTMF